MNQGHIGRYEDIHFVDHEEVGVGDTRASLTRNFVSTLEKDGISRTPGKIDEGYHRNINHVDDKICQLSGIVRGEIVTSALDEKQLTIEFGLESFKGTNIGGDVLPDSSVGTPSSLNSLDAFCRKGTILD